MMVGEQGHHEDAEDIKRISKDQADRQISEFARPSSACRQHDNNPDERLLDTRTAPNDGHSDAGIDEPDAVAVDERDVGIEPPEHGIDDAGYMVGNPVEVPGEVEPEPCDGIVPRLVAQDGELPEVVSREHGNDKADDALVRSEVHPPSLADIFR